MADYSFFSSVIYLFLQTEPLPLLSWRKATCWFLV